MLSLAAKNLWARKTRALTTTLSVFIGVTLVAGTYILTDTMFAAFDDIFSESLKGTDVVLTSEDLVTQDSGQTQSFDAGVLPEVRKVPGVALASGAIFTQGGIFDDSDEAIGSQFAPKFISSRLPEQIESLTYVGGSPPEGAGEASLDKAAADSAGLKIGDTIRIAGQRKAKSFRLVGLTQLGSASFGGSVIAQLTLPEAQRITGKVGRFDQISVAAKDGVDPNALRSRIEKVVPAGIRVETAEQNAQRSSDDIRKSLGFFRIALLVFAGVALFVGAFLIFNTFSITVAQRVTEFGMLRTLGASRGQILASVIFEALLIGVIGSVLGIIGGIGAAAGLQALLRSIGADLPSTSAVVETRTIVVALIIGISVTLVSSLGPAIRSTRISPMAALRNLREPTSRRRSVIRLVIAIVLALLGLAMTALGLFGSIDDSGQAAGLIGGGAVAVIFGVSLFTPQLVRPMASVAGIPLQKLRGLTGRLARENTQRNPGRTAVTAAALMIGLALITFVTVFAAGIKSSVASAIDRNLQGQIVIQNTDGFSPIPAGVGRLAAQTPGIGTVSPLSTVQAKLLSGGGGKQRISGVDPASVNDVLKLDWKEGGPETISGLTDRQIVLDDGFASSNGIEVGDSVRFLTQTGKRPRFEVVGTVKDNADLLGTAVVGQTAMRKDFGQRDVSFEFATLAPGADAAEVQASLTREMKKAFPIVDVLNQQELKDNQEQQVNQLVSLIYALLSLAVIVALFGIATTLALSIHERTRELGMLRAVGMSRRQVRRMIRYESVITALIGAVLGVVLGVIFAALISEPLKDDGFALSYPIPTLALILVLAALAGVLVAIGPARRAAKLDVLEALAYE